MTTTGNTLPRAFALIGLFFFPSLLSAETFFEDQFLISSAPRFDGEFGTDLAVADDLMVVGEIGSIASGFQAGAVHVYRLVDGEWEFEVTLTSSNFDGGDYFGYSVATDGDTIVVGAIGEDSANQSDPADDSAQLAGAIYIFERVAGNWTEIAYRKAETPRLRERFGYTVAVDGDTIVAGVLEGEEVRVFERGAGDWSAATTLTASNGDRSDFFGWEVSISGSTVVVTAAGESSNGIDGPADNSIASSGAVYVFEKLAARWTETTILKSPNPLFNGYFGSAVSNEGDVIAVGSFNATVVGLPQNSGAVYLFRRSATGWQLDETVVAENADSNDLFGVGVALADGILLVGASEEQGNGVDGPDDNSFSGAGAGYLFHRDGDGWKQFGYLKTSPEIRDNAGRHVALSESVAVIGSSSLSLAPPVTPSFVPRAGAVFSYRFIVPEQTGPDPRLSGPANQPDLWIGTSSRRLRGNNVYQRQSTGRRQSLSLPGRVFHKHNASFLLRIENDGSRHSRIRIGVSGLRDRGLTTKAFQRVGRKRSNVTGALVRGGLTAPLAPGAFRDVQVLVTTNRFWAGVLKGGQRRNIHRVTTSAVGRYDRGQVVTEFRR